MTFADDPLLFLCADRSADACAVLAAAGTAGGFLIGTGLMLVIVALVARGREVRLTTDVQDDPATFGDFPTPLFPLAAERRVS